ncbi:YegJ family protein [Thiolapillus sp.]
MPRIKRWFWWLLIGKNEVKMMFHPFPWAMAVVLVIVGVIGCETDERNAGDIVEREGQPPIAYVENDDSRMVSAINRARLTVDQFISVLENPDASQSDFSVKLLIKDGDQREYMWILPVWYNDGRFVGVIDNEPDKIRSVNIGDKVDVARNRIFDWMYVENGKLVGGYTLRVLRDNMSEKEREKFDRSISFRIE